MANELAKVEQQLELLTRLVAIQVVSNRSQKDQIRLLSIAGMGPTDIADFLGTTANTVNVALSSLRKGGGKLKLKSEGGKEDA